MLIFADPRGVDGAMNRNRSFTNRDLQPLPACVAPVVQEPDPTPPPEPRPRPRRRRGAATPLRPLTEQQLLERYPDLQATAASLMPMATLDEAAAAFRRSPKTIRGYIDSGKLRACRGGGSRVLIPRVEILRQLALGMEPCG